MFRKLIYLLPIFLIAAIALISLVYGGAWELDTYTYDNINISTQDSEPTGLFFKPDGTKLYEIGYHGDLFYQYTCSDAWNLSSCSHDNVNVSTQDETSNNLFFSSDGIMLYEAGYTDKKIFQYFCTSAWDLSSCSYDNIYISTKDTDPQGIFFKPDGTKLYEVGGSGGKKFYQYSCGTAWDLSSCSYDNVNISAQDYWPSGIFFKADGLRLYEIGMHGHKIYQYSCGTAWDLSSCSYDNLYISTQDSSPRSLFFKPDGGKLYEIGYTGDLIYQYSTEIDTTLPVYSDNSTNSTAAGSAIEHRLRWVDDVNMSAYIFSWHNGSNWTDVVCSGQTQEDCEFYGCDWAIEQEINISFDDFETDFGNWTDAAYDDEDWSRGTSTPSSNTGPQSGGVGGEGTNFAFVEASSQECYTSGEVAVLETIGPIDWDSGSSDNVSWHTNFYGSNIGRMYLEENSTGSWLQLWSLNGDDGNSGLVWTFQSSDVSSLTGIGYLRFRYVCGGGAYGDAAIDRINITSDDASCSGTSNYEFKNDSAVIFTNAMCGGVSDHSECWSNVTKIVNSTAGATIKWKVYANDTSNNWNVSQNYQYSTTGAADTCTCAGLNTNWEIDMSDYCVITDSCDLGTGNLTFINTGNFTCDAQIDLNNIKYPETDQTIYIKSSCRINVG